MTAPKSANWIELGDVPPIDLHAFCLAFAESRSHGDGPAVLWARSAEPQLCLGIGQSLEDEVESEICRTRGVAVTRRCLGGGAVLVDPGQWCFVVVNPSANNPAARRALIDLALGAASATYRDFGITCSRVGTGDLWVEGRKVLGSGGASVGNCQMLGASFLLDFDRDLFSQLVKAPSGPFRRWLRAELDTGMTSWREQGVVPCGSRLRDAFRRNVEALGGWRFRPAQADMDSRQLREAREELAHEGVPCVGRRIPSGIKVNQQRCLVEYGPVRAVLGIGLVARLAVDEQDVAVGQGIGLDRKSFQHCLARSGFGRRSEALWAALSMAARGTQEGA